MRGLGKRTCSHRVGQQAKSRWDRFTTRFPPPPPQEPLKYLKIPLCHTSVSSSFASGQQAKSHWGRFTTRGRYHGGRRPSSDDSFHSPTVIPSSALDKPSIMKCFHRRRTCSHTSPRRSPTMVTLHDTRFVKCRWWNDGWTVKTVVT